MRANFPLQPGPLIVLLDLRARFLQQMSVLHAGGTRGLAIQAAETAVNVGNERIGQRQPALVNLQHLVDAAARRIHLRAQRAIGGAIVQTQAAVHALGIQVPTGLLAGREVGNRILDDGSGKAQKRNLPRFKMSFGSIARLIARMLSKWVGVFSQAAA